MTDSADAMIMEQLPAIASLIGEEPALEFDAIADAAARLLDCPVAVISFVDHDRLWFKAKYGIGFNQVPAEQSFCLHVVQSDASLLMGDASRDARFAGYPMVACAPNVRFYAGEPLRARLHPAARPIAVGSLCVMDHRPRPADPVDGRTLYGLARSVEAIIQTAVDAASAAYLAKEMRQLAASQSRLHRQMQQAERIAGVGSWRLTLADKRVEWSEEVYAIHEIPAGDTERLADALSFYPEYERPRMEAALERAMRDKSGWDLELDFITAKGRWRRVRAVGEVELDQGQPVAVIGVFQDITDRYHWEQKLKARADTDELTRVASRSHLTEYLDRQLDVARRDGSALALALIDLDHFKAVNDRFGHAEGDDILRRAAAVLSRPWLRGSFAARLGGDEFVLVITDPTLIADLHGMAMRLLHELVLPSAADPAQIVSATIGIHLTTGCAEDRTTLLARADSALYAAKNDARGTVRITRDADDADLAR